MKTIYEIALNYGYKYDGDMKAFILKLIAAMSEGEGKAEIK